MQNANSLYPTFYQYSPSKTSTILSEQVNYVLHTDHFQLLFTLCRSSSLCSSTLSPEGPVHAEGVHGLSYVPPASVPLFYVPRVMLRQRAWSLLSPQPPFPFFSLIFFLGTVLDTPRLQNEKYK
jgi:hypothetical protein